MTYAAAELALMTSDARITQVAGLSWDDLIGRVKSMPADAIGISPTFFGDATGRFFVPAEAILDISRAANRPVFVDSRWMVERGALGGYVRDFVYAGRTVARMVADSLSGAPRPQPVAFVRGQWMFDAAQLRRWNIPEARLPAGSIVLQPEESIWQRYRAAVIITSALLVLAGLVIVALLVQRRQRRRAQLALQASEQAARASVREVRELAGMLITAREHERARIARDLHDDIGQRVASLCIALSRVKPQIPAAADGAVQSLSDVEQQAMHLAAEVRHLSHELHPATLRHLGLLEALRERCDEFQQETGVPVRLAVSGNWGAVPEATALCLYRVAQEALRNIAAHANAGIATISLDQRDGALIMVVTDDGGGFDPADPSRAAGPRVGQPSRARAHARRRGRGFGRPATRRSPSACLRANPLRPRNDNRERRGRGDGSWIVDLCTIRCGFGCHGDLSRAAGDCFHSRA